MNLSRKNLERAISKGLNKSHGKTVAEQTATILGMIDIMEELLSDEIESPEPSTTKPINDLAWANVGSKPKEVQHKDLGSVKLLSDELPARLGAEVTKVRPIDGTNYRSPRAILQALEDLPESITVSIETENGPKDLVCIRTQATESASGKSECIVLRYVPVVLSNADHRYVPAAKFWTSDEVFNPDQKFKEITQATTDYLSKHPSFRVGQIVNTATPLVNAGITIVNASEYSSGQIDSDAVFAKNWAESALDTYVPPQVAAANYK